MGFLKDLVNKRNETKQKKHELKYGAQTAAYMNGIDPKAAWAGATQGIVGSIGSAATNMFGFGSAPGKSGPGGPGAPAQQNPVLWIALGIAALLMIGGRK